MSEEWNEVKVDKPDEKEKIEFEVEKDEVKTSTEEEKKVEEPKVEKPKIEEQPKELEGIDTKGAQKRIRQLIKQRKDREDEVAKLIRQNEELTNKLQKTNTDFSKLSKLNLDATEKQLTDKLELARSAYKTAHEEGDSAKILKAQEYLNETQNDLKSLGATKEHFKEQPEVQQQRQQPQQQYQQPTPDPKAQDWASKNEWFGQDKVMTAAALAIDADLKQEGFSPTEDEYYQEIDSRLKESFPHKYNKEEVSRQQESTPAQVVSGVSRSTPGSSKKVKLSKEDVRLANKWGIPLEQYAQEKLKANQAEGEYTTINMQRGR